MKIWDTNNMHRIFLATIRPINQWKMVKYPYLDFENQSKEFEFQKITTTWVTSQ
jgi:hypothetical protein